MNHENTIRRLLTEASLLEMNGLHEKAKEKRAQIAQLRKRPAPESTPSRPWLFLIGEGSGEGEIACCPLYPNADVLPDVVLEVAVVALAQALAAAAFLEEMPGMWTYERRVKHAFYVRLNQYLGVPVEVISKDELVHKAKTGEIQVRLTTAEEDVRLTRRLYNIITAPPERKRDHGARGCHDRQVARGEEGEKARV